MTHRIPWSTVPDGVVRDVEAGLGARIVATQGAAEGFSPAAAVSAELSDGRRVFLKAITAEINAHTVAMQEHEAMVVEQLPASVPTPRLLFGETFRDWQVLAFEHLAAQPIADPYSHLRGVDALYDALDGVQVSGLIHILDHHPSLFTSWKAVAKQAGGFDALADLELGTEPIRNSNQVLHCDARDDNALLADDGRIFFVDWANACVGAPLIDAVGAVPALAIRFGASVSDLVGASRIIAEADPELVTATVAALAGYFAYGSTLPAPDNMPTVRAFQRAQAVPMLEWLNELVGARITVPTMAEVERAVAAGRSL